MDVLSTIKCVINESDIKAEKAKAKGLTHLSYNNYRTRTGEIWVWDEKKQDFINKINPVVSIKRGESLVGKDDENFLLIPAKKKVKDTTDLFSGRTARKPTDYEEVKSLARSVVSIKPEEVGHLPSFRDREVLSINHRFPENPLSVEFKREMPREFILVHGIERYYVNTEGYNYPRQVGWIKE